MPRPRPLLPEERALTENEKTRVQQVVVRRLKSEINARNEPAALLPTGTLKAVPSCRSAPRNAPSPRRFEGFRKAVHKLVATSRKTDRLAGAFAVEILASAFSRARRASPIPGTATGAA